MLVYIHRYFLSFIITLQRYKKGVLDWGTPMKKVDKKMNYYANMGSGQKSLRLQVLQNLPIHTSSNWFMACSTISESSVRMPDSKLRVPSAFIPMPAPVRLALPIYASLPSKTIILKCTLGHSTLSSLTIHNLFYLLLRCKNTRKVRHMVAHLYKKSNSNELFQYYRV